MGRRNYYKNKQNARNSLVKAAANNPHIHNVDKIVKNNIRNSAENRTIELPTCVEYFSDGVKITHRNGDVKYYLY